MSNHRKIVVTLVFEDHDPDGGDDYLSSPILLPSKEIIEEKFKASFGMVLKSWDAMPLAGDPVTTSKGAPKKYSGSYSHAVHGDEPMTEAQRRVLITMCVHHTPSIAASAKEAVEEFEAEEKKHGYTKREASALIDVWTKTPVRHYKTGFWGNGKNLDIYMVVLRKDGTGYYAKKLFVDGTTMSRSWVYDSEFLTQMVMDDSVFLTPSEVLALDLKTSYRKARS